MDELLSLLKEFDIVNLLPAADQFMGQLRLLFGLAVMAGPLTLLGLGLWYYFAPPGEANHRAGFRTYHSMGSVAAWRYAQKLAGIGYGGLGAVLTVIMGILCLFYGLMGIGTVATCALVCVILQLLLTLTVWIGIQVLVYREYDKDGNRRK